MPRKYVRKTETGTFSEDTMRRAVNLVLIGRSVRSAALELNVKFQTLARYVQKQRTSEEDVRMVPNRTWNQVFSRQQEIELKEYILNCSKMFYGLPINDCRKLAYELAKSNHLKYPPSWDAQQKAGMDWYYGYMKRHPTLSLRTPEGCSLSRAVSFNQNANQFYSNLKQAIEKHSTFADGTRIFNLYETMTCTVQKPSKVIAERGISQVNMATSGERGIHVTTCCIISASGNSLPPVIIFPRVNFQLHMLAGAPTGTLGLATPTGWMTSDLFVKTMEHFIKYSQSSKQNPSLLIYDNHESHLSIEVLNLAKDNGVVILTIPPHSSAKLQPLDVGVFSSFTNAYNASIYSWMMRNPGKHLTIYPVAACVGEAFLKSMTPTNKCAKTLTRTFRFILGGVKYKVKVAL